MTEKPYETDVVVVGAGPVGLFAVFECGMLKIRCHVVDALEFSGGQCTALYPEKPIYDIPGYPEIGAAELIDKLQAQAAPFNPVYHLGQQVVSVSRVESRESYKKQNQESGIGNREECEASKPSPSVLRSNLDSSQELGSSGGSESDNTSYWEIKTSKNTIIHCKAILIAAGCGAFGPNRPPLEGLSEYEASGAVTYMVGRKEDYRDKKVVIAGGGDSAVDWVLSLADVTEKLYVVHRRDKFRAAPESVDRMRALEVKEKIKMVVPFQLSGLVGENGSLKGVEVKDLDGNIQLLEADHLLPFYGLAMELGPIAQWGLNIHHKHIAVNPETCQTNIEGIFAVGDIVDYPGKLKLILCGFSEGAMAAHAMHGVVHPDEALHFEYSTTKGVSVI